MSDPEDCTFSFELLRRKIKLGKFTQPCISHCKHVISDIFQHVSGIWKTVGPAELLFGRVHGHAHVCEISQIRAAVGIVWFSVFYLFKRKVKNFSKNKSKRKI